MGSAFESYSGSGEFVMEPLATTLSNMTFLEQEAGISAYSHVNSVDLDNAENAYKIVEAKTSQYIVGSVALDNYGETDDVHVYVDTAGWVVAYYLQEERPSKIIDWKAYEVSKQISGSKLENALKKVCDAMLVPPGEIKYYDFRYPSATHMLIVVDETSGAEDTFRILIPATTFVFDRSWSLAVHKTGYSHLYGEIKLNGVSLFSGNTQSWLIQEGSLSSTQLPADGSYNTFAVRAWNASGWAYAAVMLIYYIP